MGLDEEAEAVEVAAGLSVTQTVTEPVKTASASSIQEEVMSVEPMVSSIDPEDEFFEETEAEPLVDPVSVSKPVKRDSYPNSMMMASTTLQDNCSACRREIKSGDSFIYCLNCGKPGHYAHLGEMIKVTGKCPVCKERLAPTMYDI